MINSPPLMIVSCVIMNMVGITMKISSILNHRSLVILVGGYNSMKILDRPPQSEKKSCRESAKQYTTAARAPQRLFTNQPRSVGAHRSKFFAKVSCGCEPTGQKNWFVVITPMIHV